MELYFLYLSYLVPSLTFVLGFAILCFAIFFYGIKPFSTLTHTGLSGNKPIPYFGTFADLFKEPYYKAQLKKKGKYGKLFIEYALRDPVIVMFDRECIKEVMVKQTASFTNRRKLLLRGPLANSLFDMHDNRWRRVRNLLSPAFSGSKVKKMLPLIVSNADNFVGNLNEFIKKKTEFELKQLCEMYTVDAICSTAFGVDIDSYNNQDHPLIKNVHDLHNLVNFKKPLFIFTSFFPFLEPIMNYFNLGQPCPYSNTVFIGSFITKVLDERERSNTTRPDLLQFLLEARIAQREEDRSNDPIPEEQRKGLTEIEIAAQCLFFFFAGFDTTSDVLSYTLYLLATNPKYQDQVREEVDALCDSQEGVTYDALLNLPVLNICVLESIRLYPPAILLDRVSSKDGVVEGIRIPAGTICEIPVMALHRDPELWEDPDEFRPERHNLQIDPYQFFPFGHGPRNCIGMRLAQMMVRVALVKVIRQFNIVPCVKTKPIEVNSGPLLKTVDGLWVGLEQRELSSC